MFYSRIFLFLLFTNIYCMEIEQSKEYKKGREFAKGFIHVLKEETVFGNVINNDELNKKITEALTIFMDSLSDSAKEGFKETGSILGYGFSNIAKNWSSRIIDEVEWQIESKFTNLKDIFWNTPKYFAEIIGESGPGLLRGIFTKTGLYIALGMIPVLSVLYGYRYAIVQLKEPNIIIETSIGSRPYEWLKWIFRIKPKCDNKLFDAMILSSELRKQIEEIINVERHSKDINELFSNIVFFGEPGNGKTDMAKAVAKAMGIDYVLISGSAIFQKNADIKALDQIFKFMARGKKLLIFIDEIDVIAKARSDDDNEAYKILTHILNYTGKPSKNFMLIGATNRLDVFDKAMHRRFQYAIEMTSPRYLERVEFFERNLSKIVIETKPPATPVLPIKLSSLFSIDIHDIAFKTDGLSYAELQTIIDHIRKKAQYLGKNFTLHDVYAVVEQVKTKEVLLKSYKKT